MVGRNGIVFSGYKSHRTTEHKRRGDGEKKPEKNPAYPASPSSSEHKFTD
jgi:hypothetical protein